MNWLANGFSSPIRSLLRPPLPEPAVLSVNVLPLTVAVPKLSMPPPSLVAGVSGEVLWLTVNVPRERWPRLTRPALRMAPPLRAELAGAVARGPEWCATPAALPTAELPEKVRSLTDVVNPVEDSMPPPLTPAELWVKVLPLTVKIPLVLMPPPTPKEGSVAELPVKVLPIT